MVTVEEVLKQALNHDVLKKFLPEAEDLESNYIDREFLFDLVHTLEPTFFKRVLKEYYDAERSKKLEK